MSWKRVKLGDVCSKIGSGATPKGGSTVYIKQGVSLIRSQNVYNLFFDYNGLVYINEEAAHKLKGVTIEENDVLLNITGDSVARTCIVPIEVMPARVNQHVAIVRPKSNILNPLFLNYYLASPFMQAFMLGLAVGKGASRNAMTKDMIAGFEVPCPSMDIQLKIVEILKSYDKLIENNRRQIALLEEAAQRLYREYFVDLRFPGHEDVKVIDGVPEGWTRKTVLDCLEMSIGGGWGKESVVGRNVIAGKVIRGTDINDVKSGEYVNVPLRYHTENDTKKRALKANDIVFEISNGNIDNIGRSLLIDDLILGNCGENTICASFCKLFRPLDRLHALLLYLEIQDMNASGRMMLYKKQGSNGINNFAFNDFISHEVLVPNKPYHLLLIGRMIEKTSIVREQLSLLKQARDRLLPKLMRGEQAV